MVVDGPYNRNRFVRPGVSFNPGEDQSGDAVLSVIST